MSSAIAKRSKPLTKVKVPKPKRPNVNNNEIVKLEKRTKTAEEKLLKMQRKMDGFGSKSALGIERFAAMNQIQGLEDYWIYKGMEGIMMSASPGIPAPYDPESRSAASVTLQANVDEIPVPDPSSNYYRGYMLMSNQGPNACYYSSNQTSLVTGDEYTSETVLQYFQQGPVFGTIHSKLNAQDLYTLSDFYPKLGRHAWKLYSNDAGQLSFVSGFDLLKVSLYDDNLDLITEEETDPTFPVPLVFTLDGAETYYFTVDVVETEKPDGIIKIWSSGAAYAQFPHQQGYNLSPLKWINYDSVEARSNQIRCNVNTTVRTNAQNKYAVNGTTTCGVFDAAGPVLGKWSEIIWTQKKHYKFLNQFGSSFAILNSFIRPWYETRFEIHNPIMFPESIYFMTYNSFQLTSDAVTTIPMQVKHQGWFDYTTTDSSIPREFVNHHGSEWVVACAAFQRLLPITDNPNHVKIHKKISQLVRWMSSSKPGPTAIRAAVRGLGETAAMVLPLIGAAL